MAIIIINYNSLRLKKIIFESMTPLNVGVEKNNTIIELCIRDVEKQETNVMV